MLLVMLTCAVKCHERVCDAETMTWVSCASLQGLLVLLCKGVLCLLYKGVLGLQPAPENTFFPILLHPTLTHRGPPMLPAKVAQPSSASGVGTAFASFVDIVPTPGIDKSHFGAPLKFVLHRLDVVDK